MALTRRAPELLTKPPCRSLNAIPYWFFFFFLFTDLALWAGSVVEWQCPFVYVSVTKVVIVDNVHMVIFERVFFLHKIEWVCLVLRILNLEGHPNCMIGQKLQ